MWVIRQVQEGWEIISKVHEMWGAEEGLSSTLSSKGALSECVIAVGMGMSRILEPWSHRENGEVFSLGVRLRGKMAKPFHLVHVWMLIVCAENVLAFSAQICRA